MKPLLFFLALLSCLQCFSQKALLPKTDFNTIYICIDSISYQNLFLSKYLKDTVFVSNEFHTETNQESYTGKYFIGQSSILEFFQPSRTNELGDRFGDWGIEFKTRQLHSIEKLTRKALTLGSAIDTSLITTVLDTLPIPWYKFLRYKHPNFELSILEYQEEYLSSLGLTKEQINQPMTFSEFNSILSNGKKYPKQFSMVTYIVLYADQLTLKSLENFAKLNNCKKIGRTFTNGTTTIEYIPTEKLPKFSIQKIEISLLNAQPFRVEKISDNLSVTIDGKKATFFFSNYD